MKRFVNLIILSAMLTSSLVSCGEEPRNSPETTEPSESVTEAVVTDVLANFEKKDFGGRAFNVLVSNEWTVDTLNQIWVEAESGDVVLDSVYRRNRAVEEHFGVKVTPRDVPYGDLAETVRREVQSGEDNTDLVAHAPTRLAPLAAEGMFLDINGVKSLDKSKPWFVDSVNSELEVAGKQYLFLTDMGFVFTSAANVMLYNRTMAEKFGLPDFQRLTLDGKWTLDEFESAMKGVSSDIDGKGVLDTSDRYVIAILWNEMTDTIPFALGQKITERDNDGKPQIVLNSEKTITIIERLDRIFNKSEDVYLSGATPGDSWKTQQEMFRDGKTLFAIMNISSITKRLREMQDDYAALPLPKYDEKQEKYLTGSSVDSSCIFALPKTVPDLEFAALITDAMSAKGAELVIPAYVDTAIKVKFSNDEESKEIYDLILAGRTIDFASIYDSGGLYLLFRNMMKAKSTDFASYYASSAPAAEELYNEIYELYKSN